MSNRVGPWLKIDFAKELDREAMEKLAAKVSRLVFEVMPGCKAGVWIQDAPWLKKLLDDASHL